MNKKAQEFNPLSIILALIGAIAIWFMMGSFHYGIIMKLLFTLIGGIACYFISAIIAEQ